jgi:hypothetical protein
MRLSLIIAAGLMSAQIGAAGAQPTSPELEACRSTGLLALKQNNPSIKDVTLDLEGMSVAKANTKVGDTPIRTVVIGDVYLVKGQKESHRTFLCLIGDKGKVELTFFTDK